MASTKEMQRRAKERREFEKLFNAINTECKKISETSQKISVDMDINPVDYRRGNYWNRLWADDYNKTDKGNYVEATEEEEGIQNFEIKYKGKAVGWFNLVDMIGRNLHSQFNRREMAAIYIQPEYRGLGIATVAYIYAMNDLGCNMIELTYERALSRIHYWQALGFKRVMSRFGQNGSRKALAILITDQNNGLPLNKNNINQIRQRCEVADWHHEARKIGLPIDQIH